MMRCSLLAAVTALVSVIAPGEAQDRSASPEPPWQAFLAAAATDRRQADAALEESGRRWRDAYAALIVDAARFLPSPRGPRGADDPRSLDFDDPAERGGQPGRDAALPSAVVRQPPGADTRRRLIAFLEKQTRKRFRDDLRVWRKWIWSLPAEPHSDYPAFKAELYARIDPRFRLFFPNGVRSIVQLNEIQRGGVPVNGIPPLRYPKHLPASEADVAPRRPPRVRRGSEWPGACLPEAHSRVA